MGLDERTDVGFELANRGVDAALDLLACQLCEPAFYLIDPGRGRRGEVDVVARASRQPRPDPRRLVVA